MKLFDLLVGQRRFIYLAIALLSAAGIWAALQLPSDNRFMNFRKAGLLTDAYEAAGRKADAIAALESTLKVFPNPRLQQRLDALKR